MAKSTSKPSGLEHDACVILHQMQTMKVQIQSIAPVHESLNLQLLQYQVNPQLLQMAQHQLHYMQVQQQLQGVTQQMHTYQRMYDQWGQHLRAIKNMYQTNNACDAQYKVPVDEYALEQERLEKERIPRENAQQHEVYIILHSALQCIYLVCTGREIGTGKKEAIKVYKCMGLYDTEL
eukprot:929025_1